MAVTPLSAPPIPYNSDVFRGLFIWVTATPSQDPLDTDNDQQAILTHCNNHKINVIFLDIWQYISTGSFNATKQGRIRQFLDVAHRSGIKVFALAGAVDWAVNQGWVGRNILQELANFNSMGQRQSDQFDGMIFDVEYWTDETNYPASTNLPGLMELVKSAKKILGDGKQVGVCAGWFLKDDGSGGSPRPTVLYNGKNAQDGEHMMDVSDFVVVMSYRDHANDNGTDGIGQISMLTPWRDYLTGSQQLDKAMLFGASETIDISPSYATYYGQTKTAMEAEHTLISTAFNGTSNLQWVGMAIHNYDGHKAMSA